MPNLADLRSPMPVNAGHSLNRSRTAWWMVTPNRDGGSQWNDLIGRNPGTPANMAGTASGFRKGTTRPGGYGQMCFDRVDDVVNVPLTVISTLVLANGVSFGSWINPTNLTAYDAVFDANQGGGNRQLSFFLGGAANHLYVGIATSVGTEVTLTDSWVANTWQRLLVTCDGTTTRIYRNGVQVGTTTSGIGSGFTGTNSVQIGGNPSGGGHVFGGAQDDASIWNRALTAAEAKWEYNVSLIGYPGVLHYPPKFLRQYFSIAGLLARRRKAMYSS